jgi:hypothetical protein
MSDSTTQTLSARFSLDEARAIHARAKELGISVSELLRGAARAVHEGKILGARALLGDRSLTQDEQAVAALDLEEEREPRDTTPAPPPAFDEAAPAGEVRK